MFSLMRVRNAVFRISIKSLKMKSSAMPISSDVTAQMFGTGVIRHKKSLSNLCVNQCEHLHRHVFDNILSLTIVVRSER